MIFFRKKMLKCHCANSAASAQWPCGRLSLHGGHTAGGKWQVGRACHMVDVRQGGIFATKKTRTVILVNTGPKCAISAKHSLKERTLYAKYVYATHHFH